jgi:hypothetical protein
LRTKVEKLVAPDAGLSVFPSALKLLDEVQVAFAAGGDFGVNEPSAPFVGLGARRG